MKIKGITVVALLALPLAVVANEGSETGVVWSRSIGLGVTYKDGNSEKTLYTANLKADRAASDSDFLSSLYAEYGRTGTSTTKKEQTEGQVRGQAEYRHKFGTERLYGSVNVEGYHDALKNVSYRVKGGPNIGYYFIQNEKMKLDASFGINYVEERVGGNEDRFAEYRAAGRYNWKISASADYYFNIEYSAQVDDTDNGSGLLVTGLKTKINNQLAMFVELRDEYDNLPDTGIAHNDTTLLAGLTYDF